MRLSHAFARHALLFSSISNAALLFFFLLGGPPFLEAGQIFSVQSLGILGSSAGTVSAINNSGSTVGFVTNVQGNQVPVSFNGGTANPLSGYGRANGINSAGTVIGTSYSNNTPYVTEWSGGQTTNLGISGYGVAINNAGQVAGGYNTSTGLLHAFVWSNGSLADLGTLGGTWSSVNGLNSQGQAAGTSSTASGVFNAFFSSGSGMEGLGTLGGAYSYGMAINNAGEIAGSAQTSQGLMKAAVWNGGKITDLGTLGGSQSYAYGVNGAGTVVGSSWSTGNLAMHGFIDTGGVMIDLNQLLPVNSGWTIDAAYGINDSGDIVGTGTLNGQSYALELATPSALLVGTPEPATLLLAGLGFLMVGSVRRLKRKGPASV
ncbi:MAG: PEP-CTERM sorting domain-containing protein [Bryobacteraceae bacterium]